MSQNMHGPQSSEIPSESGALVHVEKNHAPIAANDAYMPPGAWQGPGSTDSEGLNVKWVLHSLRRRGLASGIVGVVLGTVFAGCVYLLFPLQFEAIAQLRARRTQDAYLGKGTSHRVSNDDFETYVQTQLALIKSPFVINAALRKPGIAQLKTLQEEGNPAEWLSDEIRSVNPRNTEIIQIGLSGERPEELTKIVDAVKDAYMDEIVYAERSEQLVRLNVLKQAYRDRQSDSKRKTETLMKIQEELGVSTSEGAKIEAELQMEKLKTLRSKQLGVIARLEEIDAMIQMEKARLSGGTYFPSEFEIRQELANLPEYRQVSEELAEIDQQIRQATSLGGPTAVPAQLQRQRAIVKNQLDNLAAELKSVAQQRLTQMNSPNVIEAEQQLAMLSAERQILRNRLPGIEKDYQEQVDTVTKIGGVSVDMVTRQEELESLKTMTNNIKMEIDHLELELQKPARIQLVQEATIPDSGEWEMQYIMLGASFLATILLCVSVAVAWDYNEKRLNETSDISTVKTAKSLGSLPQLRASGLQSALPIGKISRSTLESMLTHSIDQIRATMTCGDEAARRKAMMVTSATGQEGKTTVASQLALSLARTRRKTAIIDCDLRNPQQHLLFGTQSEPGVADLLRGDVDIDEIAQPTAFENLWIVPAGVVDAVANSALATDKLAKVMESLRQHFDVLVVDSGPVLTSADSLLIGQHVDATIVSLRRDVSRIPKVNDAIDRLRSVGIQVAGTVLNGANPERRHKEAMLLAPPSQAV